MVRSGEPIAVLDSGIQSNHPDLSVCSAVDYTGTGPQDDIGHGTHVAGIAAARLNNGVGVAGTSGTCVRSAKVLATFGPLDIVAADSAVANAILDEVLADTRIIGMSFGSLAPLPISRAAIQVAWTLGTLLIAAAGNTNLCTVAHLPVYPASYPEVMSVANLNSATSVSTTSCMSAAVEIAAPGTSIYSTVPGSTYAYNSGTSMAAPMVSGVASLVWARLPLDLDPSVSLNELVRCVLDLSAKDVGLPGRDPQAGFGRVDAELAVNMLPFVADNFRESPENPCGLGVLPTN